MANLTGPQQSFKFNTDERHTTAQETVGARGVTADGKVYRYVKAGAAISAKQAVRFGLSAAGFDDVRPTSAVDQFVVGVAEAAFDSGDYGWVITNGVTTVLATDSITAGAPVAPGATAGLLVAAADTDLHRAGVVLVTAANADTDGATVFIMGAN